jgi:hypothetical protein
MKIKFFKQTVCIVALAICAACSESSSDPEDTGGDTGTDTKTDTDTNTTGDTETDTGTSANRDTADSDTIPDPLAEADCDGAGLEPARCEYEWCKKRTTYEMEWKNCSGAMTEECILYFDCYDKFFECMKTACPLGSDVPSVKTEIALCDDNFTNCTLGLENK